MVAESLHAFVCCLRVPHSALIARRYCHGRGDFVVGKLFNVTLPDRKCWRWWVTLTTDRRTDTATCSSSSSSTVDAAECQRWWLRHLWPGQTNRQTDRQTDRICSDSLTKSSVIVLQRDNPIVKFQTHMCCTNYLECIAISQPSNYISLSHKQMIHSETDEIQLV